MSTLIIPLPLSAGDTATRYDYVLTPEGQTVGVQSSAAATGLPDASQGVNETVAVVPVEALSWHQLELPKGIGPNAPRLRAVLQSLLEDRLLDDLEDLHLAIGPGTAAGGTVWVAVCGKTWLRQHLQALEAAGFSDIVNVLHGFEGDLDAHFHRSTLNGWRFDGLPWEQM